MRFTELKRCQRTKADVCTCNRISELSEAQETIYGICQLEHSDSVKGAILLSQEPGGPTLVYGKVSGLEKGLHGFHVHEYGDLSKGCESAGAHFNPDGVDHGDLENGHVGDLGNIEADENGVAQIQITAKRIALTGENSIIGRSFVIHKDEDDLGKGGNAESKKTGNAGDRLACGVITLYNKGE